MVKSHWSGSNAISARFVEANNIANAYGKGRQQREDESKKLFNTISVPCLTIRSFFLFVCWRNKTSSGHSRDAAKSDDEVKYSWFNGRMCSQPSWTFAGGDASITCLNRGAPYHRLGAMQRKLKLRVEFHIQRPMSYCTWWRNICLHIHA
jgi:hypothetical protein